VVLEQTLRRDDAGLKRQDGFGEREKRGIRVQLVMELLIAWHIEALRDGGLPVY
jgi:hypothetical protein